MCLCLEPSREVRKKKIKGLIKISQNKYHHHLQHIKNTQYGYLGVKIWTFRSIRVGSGRAVPHGPPDPPDFIFALDQSIPTCCTLHWVSCWRLGRVAFL